MLQHRVRSGYRRACGLILTSFGEMVAFIAEALSHLRGNALIENEPH